MTALLTAEAVSCRIGRRTLWEELSFSLDPGDALAVQGPSGSGKSTLLRCLGGLDVPTRGSVSVGGIELGAASAAARRRLRRDTIGLVLQDHAIVPEWTAQQNLRVVRPLGLTRADIEGRIPDALLAVGLGGRGRDRAGTMSGGEQQRLAVARVLVQRPNIVLADEPTASLDSRSAERVRAALDVLRARGSAVVVATHEPGLEEWAGQAVRVGTVRSTGR